MRLTHLWLDDFRNYHHVEVELPPGCTAVIGENGQGKTSLLEAIAWLATGRSFREVADAALVRRGVEVAVARAEFERHGSAHRVEAEIRRAGANRTLLDRRRVTRAELGDGLRVTEFTPDDLSIVKGGPAGRRRFLDDLLSATARRSAAARVEYERVLRHRNALLRSRDRTAESLRSLDVFDEQLARAGGELGCARARLGDGLREPVEGCYRALASRPVDVAARYEAGWAPDGVSPTEPHAAAEALAAALVAARPADLGRGLSTTGPHRDDWVLAIDGLDARTQASQGEQRTLALALRLGGHRATSELVGEDPVLLLDDVFSELDPHRAEALVRSLPEGQALLTTAAALPDHVRPDRVLLARAGALVEP